MLLLTFLFSTILIVGKTTSAHAVNYIRIVGDTPASELNKPEEQADNESSTSSEPERSQIIQIIGSKGVPRRSRPAPAIAPPAPVAEIRQPPEQAKPQPSLPIHDTAVTTPVVAVSAPPAAPNQAPTLTASPMPVEPAPSNNQPLAAATIISQPTPILAESIPSTAKIDAPASPTVAPAPSTTSPALAASAVSDQPEAPPLKPEGVALPQQPVTHQTSPVSLVSPTGSLPPKPEPITNTKAQISGHTFDMLAPGDVATFWNLYLQAKANDPTIKRLEARLSASIADTNIVKSALLPHVDAAAGVNQINHSLLNYNNTDQKDTYFTHNYSVTARAPLFNLPSFINISATAAANRSEEAGVAVARQSLIVKLADAYFGLLKIHLDERIAREELARLKQVLDQAQAFLKAGTGDIIAVYEAQARLDSVTADLNRTESNVRLAEQKLSSIVGKQITNVADFLPLYPQNPEPDDLDWWLTTMERHEPSIRQAKEGVSQVQEQLRAAQAEYLPTMQASGGYNVSRGSAFLPDVETRQWFIGASISVPIYSGGETTARVQRASANMGERQHLLKEILEQRRESVKQAFYNLRYNVSLIKALEQKKSSAELQLAAVKKGRSIGTRSSIDLLNAEQAYSNALRDLKNVMYDNIVKSIQLKADAGVLGDSTLAQLQLQLQQQVVRAGTPLAESN